MAQAGGSSAQAAAAGATAATSAAGGAPAPLDVPRGRVAVCCRVRPLLDSEVSQNVGRANWVLTPTSISLRDRGAERQTGGSRGDDELYGGASLTKTRSEVRQLDHLRRDDGETVMDAVFDESATTRDVYDKSFRAIVAGAADGLNGAILAYGQTSSGKTYSISGTTAKAAPGEADDAASPTHKGIIHFALDDLFGLLRSKAEGNDFLVRMSYCELYMERVNDLLRKIGPQSQHLPVKEDPEGKSFYVEGLKEKIVASPEEVISHLQQAEKRRRVAHTKYNEVSSRSHTMLTLCVECTEPLPEADAAENVAVAADDQPRLTRAGRLVIVDLAGNERMEAGTEYMAESNSINKSLFFLGKVIEKLASQERRGSVRDDDGFREHVPFRDSKLTRLLSVHLGGNSQTGLLVTLTPAEDNVEQSLTTLRFAQKAGQVRCVPKPVFVSKEHSLILKQRDIIAQLQTQVKELKDEAQRQQQSQQQRGFTPRASSADRNGRSATPRGSTAGASAAANEELAAERRERVEQLQALTLSADANGGQAVVSRSREMDAVVTALHRSNDALRKQKGIVVDELKDLHKSVTEVSRQLALASELGESSEGPDAVQREQLLGAGSIARAGAAWAPAIEALCTQLRSMLVASRRPARSDVGSGPGPGSGGDTSAPSAAGVAASSGASLGASTAPGASSAVGDGEKSDGTVRQLREENARLRASAKFLAGEREKLKAEVETAKAEAARQSRLAEEAQANLSAAAATQGPAAATSALQSSVVGGATEALFARSALASPQPRRSSGRPGTGASASSLGSGAGGAGRGRCGSELEMRSVGESSTPNGLGDCEPIVERGGGVGAPNRGRPTGSPLRRSLSRSGGLGEFEPIVERCAPLGPTSSTAAAASSRDAATPAAPVGPPPGSAAGRGQPPPPAAGAPPGPRLAAAYFRQLGVRTSWQPGEMALWRGQACRVLRMLPGEDPVRVALQTPRGSEVTADVCFLSEAPGSNGASGSAAASAVGAAAATNAVRLAPLGDVCLDRPPRATSAQASPAAGLASVPSSTVSGRAPSPLRPLSSRDGRSGSAAPRPGSRAPSPAASSAGSSRAATR
eukprot:TRINITY_DN54782_c0_g1_i1.p1 TRINITY_DN54782_c0_g1~~TRINITY_DN54782_c0_g1_i1.p1  ORF type:complete len:1127 (+),score=249.98 TRINITY_DN54782_c0_g1_i1:111-3383(+)